MPINPEAELTLALANCHDAATLRVRMRAALEDVWKKGVEEGKRAMAKEAADITRAIEVEPPDSAPSFVYEWPPEELTRASMRMARKRIADQLESLAKEPGFEAVKQWTKDAGGDWDKAKDVAEELGRKEPGE